MPLGLLVLVVAQRGTDHDTQALHAGGRQGHFGQQVERGGRLSEGELSAEQSNPETHLGGRTAAVESQIRVQGSEVVLANGTMVATAMIGQHAMSRDQTACLLSFIAGGAATRTVGFGGFDLSTASFD